MAGKKRFGREPASLIGSIMHSAPPPVLPGHAHAPRPDRVISTCLAKDQGAWHTAHDVRLPAAWSRRAAPPQPPAPVAHHRKPARIWLGPGGRPRVVVAAILGVGSCGLGAGSSARAHPLKVHQPPGLPWLLPQAVARRAASWPSTGPTRQAPEDLGVRPMNASRPPLPGTEGDDARPSGPPTAASSPSSPGQAEERSSHGWAPQTVCDAPSRCDGTWGEDGTILFDGCGHTIPIRRVSAGGGVRTAC